LPKTEKNNLASAFYQWAKENTGEQSLKFFYAEYFMGAGYVLSDDYERALWLALADSNERDRPIDRREKQSIREQWGRWDECERRVSDPLRKPVVGYLRSHPTDYRRALTLFPQELRSLWLAAFQSHLWNQVLAEVIRQPLTIEHCQSAVIGDRELPFPLCLADMQRRQLEQIKLPLPSARLHLEDQPLKEVYDRVLAAEGMELRQVRVKYPRDTFFSKGERFAIVRPRDLRHETATDDLHSGRQKLTLQFALPRGSYATILVKRITGNGDWTESDD